MVLDPHKGLFLPFGVGIVLVRDAAPLAATHSYSGHYMQDAMQDPSEVSPADLSPELSKHFRALRMWLPLMLLGTAPFAAALEEKLLLARYFYREIQTLGFEVGPLARSLDRDLPLGAARRDAWSGPTAQPGDRRRRSGGTGGCSSPRPCWTAGSRSGWRCSTSGPTGRRSTWRSGSSRSRSRG